MNATIKDVAKKAGVSTATVSRILNGLAGYKPATKQKVMQAIEDLGYRPNAVARGLVKKKTNTIGVVFPSVSSMFSAEVLQGIEESVHAAGWSAIVCNTDSSTEKTMKYLEVLVEKRVEGILFVSDPFKPLYEEFLQKAGVPVVLVSTISFNGTPYVKVDDRMAAYAATDYLIQQGHRKIALVNGGENDMIAGVPRTEGYKHALQANEIAFRPEWLIYSEDFRFASGKAVFNRVRESGVTAVFACSDELAAGLISEAAKYAVSVPEDLSVVGYDNLLVSEMTIPALTTISQPLIDMGKTAVEILFKVMEDKGFHNSVIMPHTIVERESVKRVKA
ncbi:LacI family DNA-binding transcriptional regulator [Bacillus sp. 1P06AnD]|uniref:LacI family DNA-binding transcriptional regulator n=1 Tax=Bacillus sp. 1P06AnD TaxID=3132208 RepID=UPI0039A31ADE